MALFFAADHDAVNLSALARKGTTQLELASLK
jgi:hypothetical protein